jgi:hypothetical protein
MAHTGKRGINAEGQSDLGHRGQSENFFATHRSVPKCEKRGFRQCSRSPQTIIKAHEEALQHV